jgi:hypothetical protein
MSLHVNEQLLSGLRGEKREEMKNIVLQNTILLDKLREILYNMQEGRSSSVVTDYDSPSWSHKQAHLNGEVAALKKVIELLTVTERDDHPTP